MPVTFENLGSYLAPSVAVVRVCPLHCLTPSETFILCEGACPRAPGRASLTLAPH